MSIIASIEAWFKGEVPAIEHKLTDAEAWVLAKFGPLLHTAATVVEAVGVQVAEAALASGTQAAIASFTKDGNASNAGHAFADAAVTGFKVNVTADIPQLIDAVKGLGAAVVTEIKATVPVVQSAAPADVAAPVAGA